MRPSRLLTRFGPFLDPFLVFGIFVVFLVPIISLLNLTPGYVRKQNNPNVLGVSSSTALVIDPNLTYQQGITVSDFHQTTNTSYSFEVQMAAHSAGEYQNLLFAAHNTSEIAKKLNISSSFESVASGTKVSLVIDSAKFVILDEDGTIYPPTIYVLPGDMVRAYVKIESANNVNFASGFNVELTVE